MKIVLVFLGLVTLTAAQFSQGRFSPRRSFRFDDDDFEDFFDIDDDLDSLEDLYEDLYDEDADDRAEARAKLTRLRASGLITGSGFKNSRFVPSSRRTSGFGQSGFNSGSRHFNTPSSRFNTPRPSTRLNNPRLSNRFTQRPSIFNTPRPATFNTQRPSTFNTPRPATFNTQRPSTFNTQRPSTFNNAGFRSGFTQSQNRFSNSAFNRPLPVPTTTKRTFGGSSSKFGTSSNKNAFNSINTGSTRKTTASSPFKTTLPGGFQWPGGNGYYFSMSTNGAKPITYFIRYDD